MDCNKNQKAFTLLEIIFAIVVLGIVASIGSQIIVQAYETYVRQKAVHNASFKTELAVNQIANRLAYRIDSSVVARKPGQTGSIIATDIYELINVPDGAKKDFNILEWIGYDNDGFVAGGWSGFVDLNQSSYLMAITPESNLSTENTFLSNLNLNQNSPAIMFMGASGIYRTDSNATYGPACMYASGNNACMFPVSLSGTGMLFQGGDRSNGNMQYTEFYQLAATAYSIVPTNPRQINGTDVWDLELHTNYQPWSGGNYTTAGTIRLLVKNVSVFRFSQEPNSARIKICTLEQTDLNETISICKEKAVIR